MQNTSFSTTKATLIKNTVESTLFTLIYLDGAAANTDPVTNLTTPLTVGSVLAGQVIVICCLALFCRCERSRNDRKEENKRENNASLPQRGTTRDRCQAQVDRNKHRDSTKHDCRPVSAYDQINEDEVYIPSGHHYHEIKDEDVCGGQVSHGRRRNLKDNAYNEINEDDVYIPSGHHYHEIKDEDILSNPPCAHPYEEIKDEDTADASKQDSQNRNGENKNKYSSKFYATRAEAHLPTSRDVRTNTLLYKRGKGTRDWKQKVVKLYAIEEEKIEDTEKSDSGES
ncbi:regulation of response to stimulus [Branchiostoma belcheri]|nr:regulation of response to stimulus [Branchiostoma belcheri]